MNALVALPGAHADVGGRLDSVRFLVTKSVAHAFWRTESHRIGGDVHGNDWYHWFQAEKLKPDAFFRRVEKRAYYLWQDECARQNRVIHGESNRFWELAEELERKSLLLRISEAAYFQWLNECRMMGGTVHGNDWYHWFAAEMDVAVALSAEVIPVLFSDERQESVSKEPAIDNQQEQAPPAGEGACPVSNGKVKTGKDEPASSGKSSTEGDQGMEGEREKSAQSHQSGKEGEPSELSSGAVHEAPQNACRPDQVRWTLDLGDPRFLNKVIATNRDVTVLLAVADSLPELVDQLAVRFGDDIAYRIHSGPV